MGTLQPVSLSHSSPQSLVQTGSDTAKVSNPPSSWQGHEIKKSSLPPSVLTLGGRVNFLDGDDSLNDPDAFLDVFSPVIGSDHAFLFLNPKISLSKHSENEQNVGMGVRTMVGESIILGSNLFYDTRESRHNNRFDQLGFGVEILTEWVDARANYYLPLDGEELIARKETYESETTMKTVWGSAYFSGHQELQNGTETTTTTTTSHLFEQFERAMDGYDLELGVKLPLPDNFPETRIFGGYYHFNSSYGKDIAGPKARFEVRASEGLIFDAEYYEDASLHGSNYYFGVRVRLPFDMWNLGQGRNPFEGAREMFRRKKTPLKNRMTDMVIRDLNVILEESSFREDLTKFKVEKKVKKKGLKKVLQDDITFVGGGSSGSSAGGSSTGGGTGTTDTGGGHGDGGGGHGDDGSGGGGTTPPGTTVWPPGDPCAGGGCGEITGDDDGVDDKACEGDSCVDGKNTSGTEDGTYEHPYNSIQEGVNAAYGEGYVYVKDANTYYENVIMRGGVNLIGAGCIECDGTGGGFVGERPTIDGQSHGPTVTMADNSRISGFNIINTDTGGAPIYRTVGGETYDIRRVGVYSENKTNVTIDCNNLIEGNSKGILLVADSSVKDFVSNITGNTIRNNNEEGIRISLEGMGTEGTFTSSIQGNAVSGNGSDGVRVNISKYGVGTLNASYNQQYTYLYDDDGNYTGYTVTGIEHNGKNGINVDMSDIDNIFLTLYDTEIKNNAEDGAKITLHSSTYINASGGIVGNSNGKNGAEITLTSLGNIDADITGGGNDNAENGGLITISSPGNVNAKIGGGGDRNGKSGIVARIGSDEQPVNDLLLRFSNANGSDNKGGPGIDLVVRANTIHGEDISPYYGAAYIGSSQADNNPTMGMNIDLKANDIAVVFTNNEASGNAGDGVLFNANATNNLQALIGDDYTYNGNTANNNALNGLNIKLHSEGTVTYGYTASGVEYNTADGNQLNGINLDVTSKGLLSFGVLANEASNNGKDGIYANFQSEAPSDPTKIPTEDVSLGVTGFYNHTDGNGLNGLNMSVSSPGNVVLYTGSNADGNGADGVHVDILEANNLFMNVSNSTTSHNGGSGIKIVSPDDNPDDDIYPIKGDVGSSSSSTGAFDNTSFENGQNGIDIDLRTEGSFGSFWLYANNVYDNPGDGMKINLVGNTGINAVLYQNTANDNQGDGIDFNLQAKSGNSFVKTEYNIFTNNGENGFYMKGSSNGYFYVNDSGNTAQNNLGAGMKYDFSPDDQYNLNASIYGNTLKDNGGNGLDVNLKTSLPNKGAVYINIGLSSGGNTISGNLNGVYLNLYNALGYAAGSSSSVNFIGNNTSSNRENGIFIDFDDFEYSTINLIGNTVDSNGAEGAKLNLTSGSGVNALSFYHTFTDNVMTHNLGNGITINESANSHFIVFSSKDGNKQYSGRDGNLISDNGGDGVKMNIALTPRGGSSASEIGILAADTVIANNGANGMTFNLTGMTPTSTVLNFGDPTYNASYNGYNSIYENVGYDFLNNSSYLIKAENNWWGENPPDTTDFSNPVSGGSIDYDPYLSSDPNP
ncbi:MAG: hypothetical protein HYZ66_04340 [Chlamydiae bacterium]|nr:hypothetical protein [Chlamydiota bacterium]